MHMNMKIKTLLLAFAAVLLLASCGPKKEMLFNGKDLTGWRCVLPEDATSPAYETFYAKDGVLCITGTPFGYIRTDKKYADYQLHLEWRWAGDPADGGIFNRLQDPDVVWPVGIQFQMRDSDFGYLMGGIPMEGVDASNNFYKKLPLEKNPEKPAGQWNTADFTCKGELIEGRINGVLVNKAVCGATEGYIGFQSEGGPIEIRNIYLTPVK